jgi:hypothetical protein
VTLELLTEEVFSSRPDIARIQKIHELRVDLGEDVLPARFDNISKKCGSKPSCDKIAFLPLL